LNILKIIQKKVNNFNFLFLFLLENSFDSIENRKSLNEDYNNLMAEENNNNKRNENNERKLSGNLNDSINRKRISSYDDNFNQKKFISNLYDQYIYEFRDEILNFKEHKEKEILEILKKFFSYKFQFLNEVNANENNIFKNY